MSKSSGFTVDLYPTGDDGAFRLENTLDEMQRRHVMQDGSELTVYADLYNVTHGRRSPQGDAATLIVMDFRFTGSDSNKRRFREATIMVKFELADQGMDDESGPEVLKIAPHGTFFRNQSTQEEQIKANVNATASGGGGPVNLGIGAGWEKTKTITKEDRMALSGNPRIEGRRSGSYNAARWKLRENKLKQQGLPSFFRTAILISPRSTGKFKAIITVQTEVSLIYSLQQSIKKFAGGRVVDPVYFDVEAKRKALGPKLDSVEPENMEICDLEQLKVVEDGITL